MRTSWLVCLLVVAGACSSGGTNSSGGDDAGRDAAVVGRDSGSGRDDAGLDAAQLFPDAAVDASVDAGRHVPTRADMAGLVLNGTVPPGDIPAPDFAATAHTGDLRARGDLLGHPTVMWFYPEAYTGG